MGIHGIDDAQPDPTPRFVVAKYKRVCRVCGDQFESEDGYAAAQEMADAHEEAEHLS